MSKKTIEIVHCDCCGKDIEQKCSFGDIQVKIESVSYNVYYGGVFDIKDICQECNKKLVDFMNLNDMFKGQKR